MRHKYLTADRHPNASPSSSRCTWYFPRGRGSWRWISFFNHSPPPKTLPRHLCAPRVRRFGPSIRHANTNSAERVRPEWTANTLYIHVVYVLRGVRREREREREARCKIRRTVALFRRRARWVLTSDRTVNLSYPSLTAETIYRGNTVWWYEPAMLNSNYNFNYSRFEIDRERR